MSIKPLSGDYRTPSLSIDRVMWSLVRVRRSDLAPRLRKQARWSIVKHLLSVGSTSAVEICMRYGADPDATTQAQDDRFSMSRRRAKTSGGGR